MPVINLGTDNTEKEDRYVTNLQLHGLEFLKHYDVSESSRTGMGLDVSDESGIGQTKTIPCSSSANKNKIELMNEFSTIQSHGVFRPGMTIPVATIDSTDQGNPTRSQSFQLNTFDQTVVNPGARLESFSSPQPPQRIHKPNKPFIRCPNNQRQVEIKPASVHIHANPIRQSGIFFTNRCNSQSMEDLTSVGHTACPHQRVPVYGAPTGDGTCTVRRGHPSPDPLVTMGCALNQSFDMEQSMTISEPRPSCSMPQSISLIPREQAKDSFRSGVRFVRYGETIPGTARICKLIIIVFICLVAFSGLGYRLADWFARYRAMKSYFIYTGSVAERDGSMYQVHGSLGNRTGLIQPIQTLERQRDLPPTSSFYSSLVDPDTPRLTLTLCNINPMRGSSLFAMENGSGLYDFVMQKRQAELEGRVSKPLSDSDSTFISVDLLARTGHRIEEMLKNCQSGEHMYKPRNFSAIRTRHGLCHLISLDPSVQQVKFVLDSQDYDYLLPNLGLNGFRVWVHASEAQARNSLQINPNDAYTNLDTLLAQTVGVDVNEVVLSSEFQTIVRVALGVDLSLRSHLFGRKTCISPENCKDASPHGHTLNRNAEIDDRILWRDTKSVHKSRPTRHIRPSSFDAQIISTTQALKSNLLHSLMSLRAPQLFRRNALTVAWAQRIQQRAFLRLANLTAFQEVQKLVSGFAELQNELEKTTTQLQILQSHLWSDERVILQRQRVEKDCQMNMVQNIQILSNITSRFRDDLCQLPFTDGLYAGSFLRCEPSKDSVDQAHDVDATFIQAVLQLKSRQQPQSLSPYGVKEPFSDTAQPHSSNNDFKPDGHDAHYLATSQPSLLELQVVNLFFSSTSTSPRLKDILRNYLRVLSAKRMQIRPRKSGSLHARKVSSSEDKRLSDYGLMQMGGDLCSDAVQDKLSARYHDFLEELGKRIASCLQRLDTFSSTMTSIVEANKPLISTFKISSNDLTRIPQSSLVTFTVQVETMGGGLSTSRMVSLDTVFNPFSEVLGICFATLGFLIPLLLLIDYAFSQMYRTNLPVRSDS